MTKTPKTTLGKETQQRRRRALGDISNRKGSLGGGNNNKNLAVKKQQPKQVNFATPSSKPSNIINASKLKQPVIHIEPTIQEKPSEHDYDSVLGRTTRWSTSEYDEDNRSPFDIVSKEELFMVDTVLEELDAERRQKGMEEQRRMERLYEEKLREGRWDAGLEDVDGLEGCFEDEDGVGLILKEDEWEEEEDGDDLLNLLEELDF
jgi:hypothetical protein